MLLASLRSGGYAYDPPPRLRLDDRVAARCGGVVTTSGKEGERMKKKKLWHTTHGGTEDGRQFESAGIKTPEGKSIFQIDLGEFFGMSNHMADRIVMLLNKAERS